MDILAQSALILAVISFALAITALARNLLNRVVMAYALLCMMICFWAFSFFLNVTFESGSFYKLHLFFHLLIAPSGLYFVQALTRVYNFFLNNLLRLTFVYTAACLVALFSSFGDHEYVRLAIYFAPTFIVFGCFHLMWLEWRLQHGIYRSVKSPTVGFTKRYWIYVGALLILFLASMDHVEWMGKTLPSVGNLFLCFYLFMISEAIIHQRLLNFRGLSNRVLIQLFIATCITFVYTIFVSWIQSSASQFILNTFIASFIILMIIDPLRKLTSLGVVKYLSARNLAFEKSLNDAKLQLSGALDTAGVAQLTLHFLDEVLNMESASIFILRSDGTKYRRIRGLRDEALETREVLQNHSTIEYLKKISKREECPVVLDSYLENEILQTTSKSQREVYDNILKGLQAFNANIMIPFLAGEDSSGIVLGFATIKSTRPPQPWGNNWGVLRVMYPFFSGAAKILKNMDVYVRLREKDRLAALGEMAAGLAHEIRNPLGAIKGAAQILESEKTVFKGKPQEQFLQVIVEEVDRLNKVVTQFLDYSKPFSIDFIDFSVVPILEKTAALFQSEGRKDIQLNLELPLNIVWPKIKGSPEQLKQVLLNLIQNSICSLNKKIDLEPKRIILGAGLYRKMTNSPPDIFIYVEDNGAGISKEHVDKIFIPFFTTDASGTGLGLSICSRIIEAHGGRIEVTSEEKSTTRFTVFLPARELTS